MINVIAPAGKRLVWYLAMEEYLAKKVEEEMVFFWIVSPTVIFGRHQVMENEVNMEYCRKHDVKMFRRKSGGGCVYSDGGNLMVSYITPSTHSESVFQSYLDRMTDVLRKMGYPAAKSSHNDIMVGDRKVSGNACYALPTGTIVHGTMMWNVDFEALSVAITPSREKLAKHGVESVRQRVANLSSLACETTPCASIEQLKQYLSSTLADSTRQLTEKELNAIDEIEQTYLNPDFLYGSL